MSLGTKLSLNKDSEFNKKIIRIDSVIIPNWALNGHHFIQKNYLALESLHTRENIHYWIDLVFGKNQQNHECFNAFKPLTSEVDFINV